MNFFYLILFSVVLVSCKDPVVTKEMKDMEAEMKQLKKALSDIEAERNKPLKEEKRPQINSVLRLLKEKEKEVHLLQEKVQKERSVYDALMSNFTEFKETY